MTKLMVIYLARSRGRGHARKLKASFDVAQFLPSSGITVHFGTTMADEDVATKAPESDTAEQSAIPGDTPAQAGPTMGVSYSYPEILLHL